MYFCLPYYAIALDYHSILQKNCLSLQQFGAIRVSSKFRSLMICHTEQGRTRRIIYYKAIEVAEAPCCVEQRRLFASSISSLYTKHLFQKYQKSVCIIFVALCALLFMSFSLSLHFLGDLCFFSFIILMYFSFCCHYSHSVYVLTIWFIVILF